MRVRGSWMLTLAYTCLAAELLSSCVVTSQGLWSSGRLSTARYLLAATSLQDQVIFAGGATGSTHNCVVDRYSASTDSWSQECLSVARSWLSAASISFSSPSSAAFALVAGGYTTSASNRIDIFSAQTLTWFVSPVSLSVARFSMAAASLDSLSLAFFAGGREVGASGAVFATVDVLKMTASGGITAQVLNMSVPRHALSATSLPQQSIILFAGGFTSAGSSSSVVDIYNAETQEWNVASLSVSRAYLATTTLAAYSLAFFGGGFTGTATAGACSKVVDIYNGVTKTWSQATLSVARHFLAAAALELQGIVVFAGGLKSATSTLAGQYSNDVDVFIASSNSWTTYTITTARSFLVPAVLPQRGLLYLGGGFLGAATTQIDIWDVRTDSLGPLSPSITLSNPARGGKGISMTISMIPASPIPISGKIVITLPGSFGCNSGTPVSFLPRGNPLRSAAVFIDGSFMTITILSGVFMGGDSFSMTFSGVTNPSVPQAFSSAVNAATLKANGLTIGTSSIGNLVEIVPDLGLDSPMISLSDVAASKTQVSMTISFVPAVSIPSTGRLLITLPGLGWELPASSNVAFTSFASGAAATASIVSNSSVLVVQFASGLFPPRLTVTLFITGFKNPPANQALNPGVPLNSRVPLKVTSALTDVSSTIIASSVEGTIPHIIDYLGCSKDFYFDQNTFLCMPCATGTSSQQGSTSSSACQKPDGNNWTTFIIASVSLFFALLIVISACKFYCIWKQSHKLLKLIDIDDQHIPANASQPPSGYSKFRLLLETCKFQRPFNSTCSIRRCNKVTSSGRNETKNLVTFHELDKTRDKFLWYFVTSKLRTEWPAADWISRIEFVRKEENMESDFCNKVYEASRAESILDTNVKFETVYKSLIETPQFQRGLKAYSEEFCSRLIPGLDHVRLMFAWHGCGANVIHSICDSKITKVAKSTDPGFFGEACYLSPECLYSLRYSNFKAAETDEDIGVILCVCECPMVPYVVTSFDYPIAEPPLRDPGIPYGFSRFFGRQMQLACQAHWVSVKKYDLWQNNIHSYFGNPLDWAAVPPCFIHKPSGKMADTLPCQSIEKSLRDLQQKKYQLVHSSTDSYQFQANPGPGQPKAVKSPDQHKNDSFFDYPNMLLPHCMDYQYHPEDGCEGHELVLPEGKSFPIAIVWFKKNMFDRYTAAAAAAGKRAPSPPPDLRFDVA